MFREGVNLKYKARLIDCFENALKDTIAQVIVFNIFNQEIVFDGNLKLEHNNFLNKDYVTIPYIELELNKIYLDD